jgi:hypothetical protein
MMLDTYLTARQHQDVLSYFTARELDAMDMDEFARLTGRQTPAQAAIRALDAQYSTPPPASPQADPGMPEAPQQPDFAAMDMSEYAAYREASGLAARSSEGTSRASLSMAGRYSKQDAGQQSGRASFYR